MSDKYLSNQIQQVLKLVELMAGNEINGAEPSKLARALNISPAGVTRLLKNLEHANWAERLPENDTRWRLHKKPVQLSNTVEQNFRDNLRRLQTEAANYNVLG